MSDTALITGIGGQDGVLLARLLLRRGYRVVGLARKGSPSVARMQPYLSGVELVSGDIRDGDVIASLLARVAPTEIYNLAALSSVGASWNQPQLVAEINAMAVVGLLQHLREYRERSGTEPRFYQASSSEMFGLAAQQPQRVDTPHHPRSPYAAAKSYAHNITVNFRESYGLYACCGVLFNHESPLRPTHFVTRKITQAVAQIRAGRQQSLSLGNIDIRRDWGAAADYVNAMWRMLQQPHAHDHVIATGVSRPLREFIDVAFNAGGLQLADEFIQIDQELYRPADVPELRGDASTAQDALGWDAEWTFEGLVGSMVRADIARLESGVEEAESLLDERPT